MGYRIEYDSGKRQYEVYKESPNRFPMLALGAFALFLLSTYCFWPDGLAVIREVLIPGDNEQTLQAMETMAAELKAGTALSDAAAAFCKEIISGAKISN